MGMFAVLAAAALAGGLYRYYFSSQDEDVRGDHERERNNNIRPTSKPSETYHQDLHHDTYPERVKNSSNQFQGSDSEKISVGKMSSVSSNDNIHHQDEDKPHFPTSVPRYFEHYPNFPGPEIWKKESDHDPKASEYPYSTSTIKSTNSFSSKSSSTVDFPKLSPTGRKPTFSEIVTNKREQQEEKPSKRPPSTPSGLNPSASPKSNKLPPNSKPTLSKVSTADDDINIQHGSKENYLWLENGSLPLYLIPEDVRELIERDIVPEVLRMPLTRFTYKDYFAALLYAEEYYHEKWSDFELEDVTLELHDAAIHKRWDRHSENIDEETDEKVLLAFKIDHLEPYERPFLLSRDLVFARPSGSQVEPFQGYLYRVVKSNLVLVEFEDEFHYQHYPARRYDISFSFNRVCLKRSHQAINDLSDFSFRNFVFPDSVFTSQKGSPHKPATNMSNYHTHLDHDMATAVHQILSIQPGSPPYLLSGPRCVSEAKSCSYVAKPSITGVVIEEAVIQIYEAFPDSRILICAPYNSACDVLMRGLMEVLPESDMFRANAAFREIEEVPDDILPSCYYMEENQCFSCPSYEELTCVRVIFSTFMSSFRMQNEGLPKGHFSHIFMVDASFATEPESMVPLANFVDSETIVVISGETGKSPLFVRSDIARRYGLKTSYFERLYCDYYC
ncbi:hypothetical protein PanWU01x14_097760 [Parasponia andersonii]|uniref:Helicase MOV-10-like beta-barrel domain-containing protein n=1 Tax=Parasponia andersonii TaxID=3476 RepID=A0A2P5D4M2_PARAD|nr:hypothetical protein PanWU01x14_097760 [Parasponia andersonii]